MALLDNVHRFECRAMATTFELMVAGEDYHIAESASAAAFALIERLELQISRFVYTSETMMVAQLKPGEVYRLHKETMELLMRSVELCAATAGAFDVTLGPIMDVLRKVDHRWTALTATERKDAMARCGMNRLVLDPEHFLISVKEDRMGRPTPVLLDFGAIGKGWALDAVAKLLCEDWEIENFLIHGGTSTVLARGSVGDGQPGWPIGVGGNWKERGGVEPARISEGAISGSGFEEQGMHVVDALNGVAAARHAGTWAYAPDATTADALSTAFLAMDWGCVKEVCKRISGAGALATREQPLWMDKVRNPVRICGNFPVTEHSEKKERNKK